MRRRVVGGEDAEERRAMVRYVAAAANGVATEAPWNRDRKPQFRYSLRDSLSDLFRKWRAKLDGCDRSNPTVAAAAASTKGEN
jgi:uncharacterized protein YfiM (DUF2279 family)